MQLYIQNPRLLLTHTTNTAAYLATNYPRHETAYKRLGYRRTNRVRVHKLRTELLFGNHKMIPHPRSSWPPPQNPKVAIPELTAESPLRCASLVFRILDSSPTGKSLLGLQSVVVYILPRTRCAKKLKDQCPIHSKIHLLLFNPLPALSIP